MSFQYLRIAPYIRLPEYKILIAIVITTKGFRINVSI